MTFDLKKEIARSMLSLTQLSDHESGPIWVMNTGSRVNPAGGDVHIAIPSASGNSSQPPIMVPQAAMAFELTASAPRKLILSSPHFMAAMQKGVIVAVTESFARQVNATPEARAESSRLRDKAAMVRASVASLREAASEGANETERMVAEQAAPDAASMFSLAADLRENVGTGAPAPVEYAIPATDGELDDSFIKMVDYANTLGLEAARGLLRTHGQLSYSECQYLARNCTQTAIAKKAEKVLKTWEDGE